MLLAGGKSTRMGRDKAAVIFEGRPLWERQLATLAALQPRELFISGRPDGPYIDHGTEVIADLHPGCGPLSGLESACWRTQTPLLCVLAIDLPWMTTAFLERLVKIATLDGRGIVPRNGDYFEPLAAVYPRGILSLVDAHLRRGDHSMQRLIQRAVDLDLMIVDPLPEDERSLFRNVNAPADLPGN
ncbi:molybdopterin-guanine dinucleotide biosynthesis protein A [Chthoniobacter flavus]|nr:molybdopterin-guanine dinucleotide biosynthesis protein A [Chthoniobacter flavus]